MKQTIKLNVIPFDVPAEEIEIAFYTKSLDNYCRIHKDDLNELLEDIIDESELHEGKWLYTDFQPPKENAIIIRVNLYDNIYFSLHYYRYLIRKYFSGHFFQGVPLPVLVRMRRYLLRLCLWHQKVCLAEVDHLALMRNHEGYLRRSYPLGLPCQALAVFPVLGMQILCFD